LAFALKQALHALQAVTRDATGSGKLVLLVTFDKPTTGDMAIWQKLLRADDSDQKLRR
jgi:hypothetical protein